MRYTLHNITDIEGPPRNIVVRGISIPPGGTLPLDSTLLKRELERGVIGLRLAPEGKPAPRSLRLPVKPAQPVAPRIKFTPVEEAPPAPIPLAASDPPPPRGPVQVELPIKPKKRTKKG